MSESSVLPPLKIKVNDTFSITVSANPTTGFACCLARMPECVNLVNTSYVPLHEEMIGGGGQQVFLFVATGKGEGAIEFQKVKFSNPLEIAPQTPMDKRFVIVE